MLLLAIITSLKILAIYGMMQEGMLLHWLCKLINRALWHLPVDVYLWLRKPLTECLFCMSSFWGILFTLSYASLTFEYLEFLLVVAGVNYIFQSVIIVEDDNKAG